MADFIKNRWVLVFVLILFIMAKIPALLLPYYWDESTPYAPAIMAMYKHGVNLLPNAITPDLSRGHPLFFHTAGALWMHIFGTTYKSLHTFALFISLLLLVTIYEAANMVFNKRVAIVSIILVATHVFFYVQSSFVLPEVLVALLSFLSIYLYAKQKYLLATLSLTTLLLTKESGAVTVAIIGIDGLISFFNTKELIRTRLLKLTPPLVACLAMGLFLILQKHYNGWYLFPLHAETVLNKWPDIWYRFRTCSIYFTFCTDYEYVIFYALVLFIAITLVKTRKAADLPLLFIIVPCVLAYYLIDDLRAKPIGPGYDIVAASAFVIFYVITLLAFARPKYYDNPLQRRIILLFGFFILGYVIFSSIAYFSPRYVIACIVPILFLAAVFFDMLSRHSYPMLYYPLLGIIFVMALFSFKDNKGWGDTNIGYKYGVKTHIAVVEFMERSNFYDKNISSGAYLEREHLIHRNTGFLANDRTFTHVKSDIDSATELVIFDGIETDIRYNSVLKDSSFALIYHIEMHGAWADIFRRKDKCGYK